METTTPNKWFDLIVEGQPAYDGRAAPNALKLNRLIWEGDSPPDVVVLPAGTLLYKVSRSASEGNQYRYRVASVSHLVNGQLQALPEPPEAA